MTYFEGQTNLYDYIRKTIIPNGDHTLNVNGVDIDIEMINFNEDVVYNESPALGNDVSDSRMLILNYKGNLTINSKIMVTPKVRKKGIAIFVQKNLINNGIISMTARGAIAEGQEVYLFKNRDGTFEYVPAVGGGGGNSTKAGVNNSGNPGERGINRGTGGGGSGGNMGTNPRSSGHGGLGTSYSGGAGGGGVYNTNGAGNYNGGNASDIGGLGGSGTARSGNTGSYGIGGVGNEPGKSGWSTSSASYIGNITNSYAQSGTGGLLIIYTMNLINNGTIESNGSSTIVNAKYSSNHTRLAGGGNSGGGSINLFYRQNYKNNGIITADGGTTQINARFEWSIKGGDGGAGSITVQKIHHAESLILNNNQYKTYKDEWSLVSESPSKIDFETRGMLSEDFARTITTKSVPAIKGKDIKFLSALNFNEINNILAIKFEVK
ncbi:hypothetical protein [Lysinibacillus pakistanensis]|uniref:hypothetical protein n=1 Tax=Lysinibacillus pakistanensis TaxID=759811 RepID=UPI003D280717